MKVAEIVLPSHGGQLGPIARQFGMRQELLIDFSASISPYLPPEHVLDRLRNCAADAKFLSQYPDLENTELKDALSDYAAVPAQSIAIANGMMPLLEAALRTLELKRCLVVEPAFSGYRRTLGAAGVEAVGHSLATEEAFALSPHRLERLLAAIEEEQCDSVLLANPHSPSGVITQRHTLEDLCRRAGRSQVTVLLDEAFIDFEPEASLSSAVREYGNLVVFRSLTKFFAIPALRVAYVLAGGGQAEAISQRVPEWPISSLATTAAAELVQCRDHQSWVRAENAVQREQLRQSIAALGLTVFPGRANYLLMRTRSAQTGLALWQSLIRNHGIVLRCCQNFAPLDASYLRLAIRSPEENAALRKALAESLAELAS